MSFIYALIVTFLVHTVAAESLVSNNASLLWGPYRPNYYIGIRPRVPKSLLLGLMWGKLDDGEQNIRHTCEKDDDMAGWGWTAYESRTGGSQTMYDERNSLDLTTEFIKRHEGQSAGNWALRVKGTPRQGAEADLKTSVVFYVGMENMETCGDACELEAIVEEKVNGDDRDVEEVHLNVRHPGLGMADIRIPRPKKQTTVKGVHDSTTAKSINTTEDGIWQSKSSYLSTLQGGSKFFGSKNMMLPNEPGIGNMHFVQLVFRDNFEFDILYSSKAATIAMTSKELTTALESALSTFSSRFSSVFPPNAPFDSESHTTFSQSILSNLLGGLSYFHGDTLIDESHTDEYSETTPSFWEDADKARHDSKPQTKAPSSLFSHVPSRSMFPRGFLWDEGFHLLLVVDWDLDLALEVVRRC